MALSQRNKQLRQEVTVKIAIGRMLDASERGFTIPQVGQEIDANLRPTVIPRIVEKAVERLLESGYLSKDDSNPNKPIYCVTSLGWDHLPWLLNPPVREKKDASRQLRVLFE